MPDLDWNDLRYVLCLSRTGRLAVAARKLGVNETTVARRLARVEALLGVRLFEREAGVLRLTDCGQIVVRRAEHIELDVDAVEEVTGGDNIATGKVRITAVPLVMNYILIPALQSLLQRHPRLRVELAADPRNLRVTNREADIALRMARPDDEYRAVARRIGGVDYAVYGASNTSRPLAWITYDATLSDLPQARWMARAVAADPKAEASVVVNDSELALNAVRAGLGRSLLPCRIGDCVPGLSRLSGAKPVLSRDMWLIVHPDLKHLARVRAAITWCERLFSK